MTNTINFTDKSGVSRHIEVLNMDFYRDMLKNADTPEAAAVWLGLGLAAGYLLEI